MPLQRNMSSPMTGSIALPLTSESTFDIIVQPQVTPLTGEIKAQPSKNYTTRYLLAAALGNGESIVANCATSADSLALQRCLLQIGAEVKAEPAADGSYSNIKISGINGKPRLSDNKPLNPGNAGAVLRFLLAVGALLPDVTFVTDHPQSLGTRPNADLLYALKQMGCKTAPESGLLPITLRGGALHGGDVSVNGSRSSQFLSGLLFLAPLVGEEVRILVVDNLVSKPPIRQTMEVLKSATVKCSASIDLLNYVVQPSTYRSGMYSVNGDWPGSAAILAAAAVTGGNIRIKDLFDDEQGEKAAGYVFRQMGVQFRFDPDGRGVQLRSDGNLKSVEFDGDLATDAVLALMGAACLSSGRSRFYNVSNLRIKECDRISDPIAELRKLGVKCWEGSELDDPDPDAIIIDGNPEGYAGGVIVDGRDDHRVIMLLSIVALRCRNPVRIMRAHQVSKSYPNFFEHLNALGAELIYVEASS